MGCAGGTQNVRVNVSIPDTYQRAADSLLAQARAKGGHAVIFTRFEHRISVETLGDGNNKSTAQVFEMYGYGTAVRLKSAPQVSPPAAPSPGFGGEQ